MVASRPFSAAARASFKASALSSPAEAACSNASTAGASASYIVLSPGSALPRATTPPSPARNAVARWVSGTSAVSPRAAPILRNIVPNSGPLAPPTVDTTVMPTLLNSADAVTGLVSSRAATAACIPRSMFAPWSPSPMAASRAVSLSLFSATSSAKARIHRSMPAVDATSFMDQLAPPQCGGLHRSVPKPTVSSSTLSRVTEVPAMSSEVM